MHVKTSLPILLEMHSLVLFVLILAVVVTNAYAATTEEQAESSMRIEKDIAEYLDQSSNGEHIRLKRTLTDMAKTYVSFWYT